MSDHPFKPINITPKRLEALRYLFAHPNGVYVGGLAHAVLTSMSRREHLVCFTEQQATRSGAGYATPLLKAGLIGKRVTETGWGIVFLTEAGRAALVERAPDA